MGDLVHFPYNHQKRPFTPRKQVWYSIEQDRLYLVSNGRLDPLLWVFIGML